nr:MAG TPA: hypothetical protein [Microviridae sp.]
MIRVPAGTIVSLDTRVIVILLPDTSQLLPQDANDKANNAQNEINKTFFFMIV